MCLYRYRSVFICAENAKLAISLASHNKENSEVLFTLNDLYGNCDIQKLISLHHFSFKAKVILSFHIRDTKVTFCSTSYFHHVIEVISH